MFNQQQLAQLAPPSQQDQDAYTGLADQMMPVIQRLLSGEKIDGITPNLAQRLMGIATPEVARTMHDRGMQVNPNWYQNYIQPGTVNPSQYAAINNYARGFNNENMPAELAMQGTSVLNQPTYQMGGAIPSYRQSQLQNQDTMQRLSDRGEVYDPYAGRTMLDPGIQDQTARMGSAYAGVGPSYDSQFGIDFRDPQAAYRSNINASNTIGNQALAGLVTGGDTRQLPTMQNQQQQQQGTVEQILQLLMNLGIDPASLQQPKQTSPVPLGSGAVQG